MSGAWDETRACVNIWTCVLNILILRLAARARMMSYPLCQPESRYKSRVRVKLVSRAMMDYPAIVWR